MDVKRILGVGIIASLALMAGCDDSASAKGSDDKKHVVDTLYVHSKDTIVVKNLDTLVVKKIDTLVVNKVDTVVVNKRDTVVVKDSMIVKDTLVVKDTLMGLNGESCSAVDTVSTDGVTGFNISCGDKRVGTLWNGKDGENGTSAYEQAVAAGFVGTEEEWQAGIATRVNQDHFVDFRDGQEYRTVKIGNQTWMAQNLNYRYMQGTEDFPDSSSFCYKGLAENCDAFGRLYLFSAAIDSAGAEAEGEFECGNGLSCDDMPEVIKGICPDGWHLPDTNDVRELLNFVDPSDNENKDISGLKSIYGWTPVKTHVSGNKVIYGGNGTNIYGFEALPAGHGTLASSAIQYDSDGMEAFFWTANVNKDEPTQTMVARFTSYFALFWSHAKSDVSSVRCVKDAPVAEEEEDE